MVAGQGDVFWAEFPVPAGSEAGFRRPVVVVQGVSQIVTIDRELLARRVGRISKRQLHLILSGMDVVLGR